MARSDDRLTRLLDTGFIFRHNPAKGVRMPGPLDGVRILEFTEIVAAPFGGELLSDMGADLIKVEPPWGEPSRQYQQIVPHESRGYMSLNRGKRSLPLDLTKPQALKIVYQLIPTMDVVIINYRPDVPKKLGIDYDTLSAMNPRLVYCQNTAFGLQGPHHYRPGSDIVTQSFTGLMTAEGKVKDGIPQQIQSVALADHATGITIAWGVCAALYAREKTGRGQKVEASLMATALAIQTQSLIQVDVIDKEPREEFLRDLAGLRQEGKPYQEMLTRREELRPRFSGNIYYRTFQTKDGLITIGCLSQPPQKRMAALLGLYDPRFEEGFDPLRAANDPVMQAKGEELVRQAQALFQEKTTDEWLHILDAAGVPCGPLQFIEEMTENDQAIANGYVVELEHSLVGHMKMYGPPLRMSDTPLKALRAAPALGEHTGEILASVGYTPEEIERLRQEGVTC
jgi:crotonobetainyl-CoA:carnitine CoA-transferase CaiB-like acyl-CoA transferase